VTTTTPRSTERRCARCAVAAIFALALAGCGYKAPLYVPKPKADGRKAPVVVLPEPAPERPVPSESAPRPK
jgi:predicted small lipoprotein YifL